MSEHIHFIVEGNPLPKQSYRASSRGGGYTPARIKAWQNTVAWEAKQAMIGRELIEGIISVELSFFRDNKRKVDFDNLSKAVLDGCNGVVWKDDKQVKVGLIELDYDKDNPRVEITIRKGRAKYELVEIEGVEDEKETINN